MQRVDMSADGHVDLAHPFLAQFGTPAGGDIAARLKSAPVFVAATPSHMIDLELCVADALSFVGATGAFHDGPSRLVVSAEASGKYYGAVEILERASGARVTLHSFSVYARRMERQVRACL